MVEYHDLFIIETLYNVESDLFALLTRYVSPYLPIDPFSE